MAVAAMREWRAAPARLTRMLTGLLASEVRSPGTSSRARPRRSGRSPARPVLDRLDRFATARHRTRIHLGDADAEMRADEMLLAASVAARLEIAG